MFDQWTKRLWDHRDPESLAARMRRRRFASFRALIAQLPRPVRILDVGGTAEFWDAMQVDSEALDVTILNLTKRPDTPRFHVVAGDARQLEFEADAFDVVFSNSVIEHVGGPEDQRRAAQEIRRVAPRAFVQTPNRGFLLEPHFLVPGFQFLPIELRAWMLTKSRLGWMSRQPDRERARRVVESVRLLSRAEMGALFPDATILEERVFGLTKSLVAVSGWDDLSCVADTLKR